jgi:hypothetical protein
VQVIGIRENNRHVEDIDGLAWEERAKRGDRLDLVIKLDVSVQAVLLRISYS